MCWFYKQANGFSLSPQGSSGLEEILRRSEGNDLISSEGITSHPVLRCHGNTSTAAVTTAAGAARCCGRCVYVCVLQEWTRKHIRRKRSAAVFVGVCLPLLVRRAVASLKRTTGIKPFKNNPFYLVVSVTLWSPPTIHKHAS